MDLEINDFLPLYPDQDDPEFQSKIYNQLESRKFQYDENEKPPTERGQYYLNQYEFELFLLALDYIILISGYGTGKTCAVVKAVERFKNMYLNGESQYRRCVFVTKGKLLEDQAKEQIMCRCTKKGVYDTHKVRSADKHLKKIIRINKSIGKYWDFPHYRELANDIESHYENDKGYLIEKYDYSIFFLDEVQILNNPFKVENKDEEDDDKPKKIKFNSIYYSIIKLFDILPHKKIIIASATPGTNDVSNYIPIINLANPKENRIDLNEDISGWTLKDIYPYIMNRVIYIKEQLLDVDIVEHGSIIEYDGKDTQVKGVKLTMSKFQSKVFANQPSGNFDRKKIEASNMSYPNGLTGGEGFKSYFKIEDGKSKFIKPEYKNYFKLENIGEYSVKDEYIINMCLNNQGRKVMIYDELVVGSGLLDLAKALELAGYERFIPGTTIYTDNVISDEVCSYGRETVPNLLDVYKTKKLRYIIITQFSTNDISTIDAYNSVYNVTGNIVQVVILSKKAKDGLNLFDTDMMIRRSGPRNMTTYNQSLYRILRTGGFTNLMRYRRLDRVKVDVYNLVAVSAYDGSSIDAKLYVMAEEKELAIKKIFRYFKIVASNCHAQIKRNIRGVDGSLGCDYKKCEYKCYLPKIDGPVRTNEYNLLFSEGDIEKCKKVIINIFRLYNSIKINNLLALLEDKNFTQYIVMSSLFEIIFNKIPIRSVFGYSNFLYEKDDILYVSGEFPYNNIQRNPLDSYYTQNIITFNKVNFLDFIETNTIAKVDKRIKNLSKLSPNKVIDSIYNMDLKERAYLTEYAVMNPDMLYYDEIIETSKYFLFEMDVPVKDIKETILKYPEVSKRNDGEMRKTRGRKRKVPIKKKLDKTIMGGRVMVHSYYIIDRGSRSPTSNFFSTNTSKIRIYYINKCEDPVTRRTILCKDNKWRDADPHEKMVYERLINERVTRMLDKYNKYSFYGIIFPDKELRIVDTERLKAGKTKRDKAVGRVCKTMTDGKNRFLYILMGIDYPMPEAKRPKKKSRREYLKDYFSNKKMYPFEEETDIDKWDSNKVDYYYNWVASFSSKHTVDELCTLVFKYFKQEDMLIMI